MPDFYFGDARPDAPELAARGRFAVGVRTLHCVNPDQIDILRTGDDAAARYDRALTMEIWYPAVLPEGVTAHTLYEETFGAINEHNRPLIPFTFAGRARRDAEPDRADAPYPLLIVSHGYPGSRLMMTYLTENLASKGYVVVSIDHAESTFRDAAEHISSMLHRPLDIHFTLRYLAQMSDADDSWLSGLVDADRTGLIGYSFGGYGALVAMGAGLHPIIAGVAAQGGHLNDLVQGSEAYQALLDRRIKAAVLLAPYGGDLTLGGFPGMSFWDQTALEAITIPTFWAVGSLDDVSMYQGVRKLFDWAVNSERYLLTFENARHNVGGNPPPPISTISRADFARYAEYAWDKDRMCNINQHFVTAMIGLHLKGLDYADYLHVPIENASAIPVGWDQQGYPVAGAEQWKGFLPRTAIGLRLVRGAG